MKLLTVQFLDKTWSIIGTKSQLALAVNEITGIDYGVLCGHIMLPDVSIAERMSWAANRRTTKIEDRAYSLLGIFGIHMTTIYGEGLEAFRRLQYEIISKVNDHSILAWSASDADDDNNVGNNNATSLFAPSPDVFSNSGDVVALPHEHFVDMWKYKGPSPRIQIITGGLVLELPVMKLPKTDHYLVAIGCGRRGQNTHGQLQHCLGIVVCMGADGRFRRMANIDCVDAGRMRTSGHGEFKVSRLETMEGPIQSVRYIVTAEGKSCRIRIATSMLDGLRDDHQLEFLLDECKVAAVGVRRSWPFEGGCQEEEDPETKEKHVILTAPYGHEYKEHVFELVWSWSGVEFRIRIAIDAESLIQCNGLWDLR